MSDLKNPMEFNVEDRVIDIENYLRHEDFTDKQVTEIEFEGGRMYVHWEERD